MSYRTTLYLATFLITFSVGVVANSCSKESTSNKVDQQSILNQGTGASGSHGPESPAWLESHSDAAITSESVRKTPIKFLRKPRPQYTGVARDNSTQGNILLRVTFLASGQIGAIEPVKTLPDGLTEQAVKAASQIKFDPARLAGRPITVTKTVEYTFSIY